MVWRGRVREVAFRTVMGFCVWKCRRVVGPLLWSGMVCIEVAAWKPGLCANVIFVTVIGKMSRVGCFFG